MVARLETLEYPFVSSMHFLLCEFDIFSSLATARMCVGQLFFNWIREGYEWMGIWEDRNKAHPSPGSKTARRCYSIRIARGLNYDDGFSLLSRLLAGFVF